MKNQIDIMDPKFPIYDDGELHISISRGNIKVGNIPQFNTLPGDEILTDGKGRALCNIVGTCGHHCAGCKSACYAIRTAKFHNNTCIPAWGKNTVIMRNDLEKLVRELDDYLNNNLVSVFRFHTSGALESLEQILAYHKVITWHPETVFYIYTKEFDILSSYFNWLVDTNAEVPENFVINLSEWKGNVTEYLSKTALSQRVRDMYADCNVFSYDDGSEECTVFKVHCPAVRPDGTETGITCAKCRRCFKRGNKTSVYDH